MTAPRPRRRPRAPETAALQALLGHDEAGAAGEPRIRPAEPRRLSPLPRIVSSALGRAAGTGPAHIFTTLGQNPRLFRAWLWYSAHLMPLGRLPRGDTELVILRVAWRCESAYEWSQHVPIALRAGLSAAEVAGVAGGRTHDEVFTARQRSLLVACDELLARRVLTDATWSAVRTHLPEREVIELCLLIGHYQGLATAIGALGVQVER